MCLLGSFLRFLHLSRLFRLAFFLVLLIAGLEMRVEHLKWHIFVPLGQLPILKFRNAILRLLDVARGCFSRFKKIHWKSANMWIFLPLRVFWTLDPGTWTLRMAILPVAFEIFGIALYAYFVPWCRWTCEHNLEYTACGHHTFTLQVAFTSEISDVTGSYLTFRHAVYPLFPNLGSQSIRRAGLVSQVLQHGRVEGLMLGSVLAALGDGLVIPKMQVAPKRKTHGPKLDLQWTAHQKKSTPRNKTQGGYWKNATFGKERCNSNVYFSLFPRCSNQVLLVGLWFCWHQLAAEGVCTVFPQTRAAALGLQLGSRGSLLRVDNLWGACWLSLTWEWYKLHPREPWDGLRFWKKPAVRVHCYTKFWRWLLAIWGEWG